MEVIMTLVAILVFGVIDPTFSVIVVALISPLVTYLVAAKKLSGRIKDSDASELWSESRSIREWSTARVRELNDHVDALESRLGEVESANGVLAEENRKLSREIYALRNEIHLLQGQNVSLTSLLEQERAEVSHLRWEAEHAPRRRASDPPINEEPDSGGST